jgi:hypothetical protein
MAAERFNDNVRQIRVLWRSMSDAQKAEFMTFARLIPDPESEGTQAVLGGGASTGFRAAEAQTAGV